MGDISWIVPTLHVSIATSPRHTAWHAWPVVATSGMSIGHKGLIRAVDLYERPAALEAVRAEFKKKKGDVVYKPYVPEGPPPLPHD